MNSGAYHTGNLIEAVISIILLLMIASLVHTLCQHFRKLPFTIALVISGLALSSLAESTGYSALTQHLVLTPEMILFVFLPTLIFESALHLDFRQVFWNIGPILFLAVPGLLLSAGIIGSGIWLFTELDFILCLLLGTILSATDPVAVIALFRKLGVPERLTVLVEGESLFNDATSLVLATLLATLYLQEDFSGYFIARGSMTFLGVFFGGILTGWLLAVAAGLILGKIRSDISTEITFTTILAYLSFVLAEHILHVSGIMAVVAAGLTIGSWGRSKIAHTTAEFMERFWGYMAYVANAFIFLLVGFQIDLLLLLQSIDMIALAFIAMLFSRAIIIYLLLPLTAKLPNGEYISHAYRHVMYWGGLRGAIALAIVLSLPEFADKQLIITTVMGAVLATLLIQGLSIETLVKRLGVDQPGLFDKVMRLAASRAANAKGKQQLETLKQKQIVSADTADKLIQDCEQGYQYCDNSIHQLEAAITEQQSISILYTQCQAREKSRYYELFNRGLISESAFRELEYTANDNIDRIVHHNQAPQLDTTPSLSQLIIHYLMILLEKLPFTRSAIERLRVKQVIHDYTVAWARDRAFHSVLKDINRLPAIGYEGHATTDLVKSHYQHKRDRVAEQIQQVENQYPEFVETVQYQLSEKFMLIAKQEEVRHQDDFGLIPHGIAETIIQGYNENIRSLNNFDLCSTLEISPQELLKKVPFFQAIDTSDFERISHHLIRVTFPKGSSIICQGEKGNAMYLFARGTASVLKQEENKTHWLANVYPGDIIGEAALLEEQRRNASVQAVSPCTVYKLDRNGLQALCDDFPQIKQAIDEVHAQRTT